MANAAPYTVLELAAGAGMLGAGLKLALESVGVRARVVGGVERDASAAAAFLAALEREGSGGCALWDDLTTFIGRRERGLERVDALCAGYPCQPFSSAGKRRGAGDSRHLWPFVRRVIARVEPGVVFLENVDGHVTLGLRKVLRDLKRLGYEVACGVFSAEEVGAPHGRKRVFILGKKLDDAAFARRERARQRTGSQQQGRERLPCKGRSELGDAASESGRRGPCRPGARSKRGGTKPGSAGLCDEHNELADAECLPISTEQQHGARERPGSRAADQSVHDGDRRELADSQGNGWEQRRAQPIGIEGRSDAAECGESIPDELGNAKRRGFREGWRQGAKEFGEGFPLFPPGRTDYRRWAGLVAGGLDPTLMPAIESGLSVVAHGMAPPADLLRIGGNGVVPLQAAWAFLQLFCCLMEPMEGVEPIAAADAMPSLRERNQLKLF